ncbi:beta-glucosidase [Aeromonas caviae]|uniref:beta-glucosidase n=1 Tax=Aeromonas caviae TaxID=648 RepID=UPI003F74863C
MRKLQLNRRTKLASLISTLLLLSACGGGDGGDNSNNNSSGIVDTLPAGHTVSDNEADSRARSILAQMTLAQKIELIHGHGSPVGQRGYVGLNYPPVPNAMQDAVGFMPGIPALGVPANNMADASNGATVEGVQTTSLPASVALAATFSTDMARLYGDRIGAEIRILGFTTALGGGVNLIRDPRNGRGFEYMGEDPILAGELGAERTIAVQKHKVISTIKHFAFNNYETNRMVANNVIDEQTMRETELLAFEIAITKGNPGYVMCAFNRVNGDYSCENEYLLKDVLKGEWGYKGIVLSDWGAQSSTIKAANNGLDEEQPGQEAQDTPVPQFMKYVMGGPWFIKALQDAAASGDVPMSRIDDMVFRKLRTMIAMGLMDTPPQERSKINEAAGNADAKKLADASMVLMQNKAPANGTSTEPVLPLSKNAIKSILIVGGHADKGVVSGGGSGGSSPLIENQVDACGQLPISPYPTCPNYIGVTPLEAIKAEFPNAQVTYLDGNDTSAAAVAAAAADVTLIFAAKWLNEGSDVPDMALSSPTNDNSGTYTYDQDALIAAVAPQAKKSVVILETGQPVLMPWIAQVDAVLNAWYPGVRGAYSIADILSGDVNPSGKLPVTFPESESDLVQPKLPTNLGSLIGQSAMFKTLEPTVKGAIDGQMGAGTYDYMKTVNYREKLAWNGYKWMDANNIAPLFAFGHGLSYSTFAYSDVSSKVTASGDVNVTFTISNTSGPAGTEVAQVYATLPDNVPGNVQPPKKLVGWSRVELASGESKEITVTIPKKYISTWDAQSSKRWITTPGNYVFTVSDSSNTTSINALTTTTTIQ